MNNALKLIRAQHGELKFDRRPSCIIAPRCGRIIPELRSRMRWNRCLQLIILSFSLDKLYMVIGCYTNHNPQFYIFGVLLFSSWLPWHTNSILQYPKSKQLKYKTVG